MKTEQRKWTELQGWIPAVPGPIAKSCPLVLVFGDTRALRNQELMAALQHGYPAAHIFGCSTAGENCGTVVSDDSLVVTAVQFEHTPFLSVQVDLQQMPDGFQAGEEIARKLPRFICDPVTGAEEKLAHVLVLSDGLEINGVEEEVEAVRDVLGDGAVLTGFYFYGEISPFTLGAPCELHNQTMTITTLSEM